jgi:hypothetical protein
MIIPTSPETTTPPPHTCSHGPVCAQMDAHLTEAEYLAELDADPMSAAVGFRPPLPDPAVPECAHLSCLVLVHGFCPACYMAAFDEEFGL